MKSKIQGCGKPHISGGDAELRFCIYFIAVGVMVFLIVLMATMGFAPERIVI